MDQHWFFWIAWAHEPAALVSSSEGAFHPCVMDYGRFRCRHCRKLRRKRTLDQRHCGASECQKARKNAWRREKYAQDFDYRANQRDSTNAWLEEQGGSAAYHRAYRRRRKKPSASRAASEQTPPLAVPPLSAKRDAKFTESALPSGVYTLVPAQPVGSAKRDALLVEIAVVPRSYGSFANIDSMATQGGP